MFVFGVLGVFCISLPSHTHDDFDNDQLQLFSSNFGYD